MLQAVETCQDSCLHEAMFTALVDLGARSDLLGLKCPGLGRFLRRAADLPGPEAGYGVGSPMSIGPLSPRAVSH